MEILMQPVIDSIRNALNTLNGKDLRKYRMLIGLQIGLSLLDIVGVALIGALGALSIRGINSTAPGNRVAYVLNLLNISNMSFQTQAAVISILATSVLISKTIISMWLTRKTLLFLSLRTYELSAKLNSDIFTRDRQYLNTRSSQQFLFNVTAGTNSAILGILGNLMTLISDSALLILMLITVTIVDPIMAVISVLLGFIVVKFGYFRMHKIASKLGHDHAKLNVSANSEFLNLFNSYREFFVRNQVETQLDKFNSRQKRLAIVNGELSFLPSISKYVVEGTVILSALLISASQFVLKDASQAAASLSIFFAASTRVAPAAMRVQQSLIQIQSSSAISQSTYTMLSEIKDFKEITIAECKSEACDGEFVPKVDINDLHFRYLNSPETVINILNLSVRQGESFGIVGPSGSGKSTLADLILGLLEPDSGSIQISGVNPSCALNRWPGKIGYVPQEVQILDGTIRENIVFGSTVVSSDDTLLKLLHLVQLSDLVSSSEELNSQVGENGSRLSGGQRQRLGIARALYTNPSLLILDEISSALDAETESAITSLLESLKGHVTIILIAHRLSTVRNCTKIAYLSEGEIVGVGSFNELRLQIKEFDHQARLMGL